MSPSGSSERHIRPLLERLQADEDRIAVWRDVPATTNGIAAQWEINQCVEAEVRLPTFAYIYREI